MCVAGGRFKKEIVVDGQSYLLLIRDEGGPPEAQVSITRQRPTSPTPVSGNWTEKSVQRAQEKGTERPRRMSSAMEGLLISKALTLLFLQIESQRGAQAVQPVVTLRVARKEGKAAHCAPTCRRSCLTSGNVCVPRHLHPSQSPGNLGAGGKFPERWASQK